MGVRADAETLRGIPIFAACDPVHLQLLAFSSERCTFRTGEVLMTQGQPGAAAYLLLNGEASLSSEAASGPVILGTAGPGAFLGEVAMIGDVPYSITAIAKTPLSAARVTRSLFMRVAEEYPDFGAAVFRALAHKLEGSMSDLAAVQPMFDRAKPFSRR
jgi:CRP/FNR family cyclic AMP-dependent transcriptional regulator